MQNISVRIATTSGLANMAVPYVVSMSQIRMRVIIV
jgi:hypothetical protein